MVDFEDTPISTFCRIMDGHLENEPYPSSLSSVRPPVPECVGSFANSGCRGQPVCIIEPGVLGWDQEVMEHLISRRGATSSCFAKTNLPPKIMNQSQTVSLEGPNEIFRLTTRTHPPAARIILLNPIVQHLGLDGVTLSDGNHSVFRFVANLLGPLDGLLSQ